jgi:hypothetical protein
LGNFFGNFFFGFFFGFFFHEKDSGDLFTNPEFTDFPKDLNFPLRKNRLIPGIPGIVSFLPAAAVGVGSSSRFYGVSGNCQS